MLNEVFSADFGFRKIGVRSITASRDDRASESVLIQFEGMIEARLEHRRWPAVVLRRSQYNDGVRRARFFAAREVTDCTIYMDEVNEHSH